MTLRVSGKNFSIGDSLREHILTRVESAAQKYFDGAVTGHIVIDHEGSGYRADCVLHLASGITLQAEGRSHEPYVSFDQAADRLEKRLRRYKTRLKEHHQGARGAKVSDDVITDSTIEPPADDANGAGDFHPVIVAEQTHALKRLSVSEAVLHLDMTGAYVLVFRHATTDRVNTVYRRPDGNISWLDPSRTEPVGQ